MLTPRTTQILAFLQEIEKYKTVIRRVRTSDPARMESDAEHSWHFAMMVLLLAPEIAPDADMAKLMKFALMHDLVEIYAGDTFAFDATARETKATRKQAAAHKFATQLPDDLGAEFLALFNEFEADTTCEAQIAQSFDKLQPIIKNLKSDGWSWREHGVSLADVDAYKRDRMTHDPHILAIYDALLTEAQKRKLLN